MEISRYDEKTVIFYDSGVRFFLLEGNEKAALIDTGMNVKDMHSLIREYTDLPCILLNTHADMDHVGANGEFDEVWLSVHEMAHYAEVIQKPQILHALFPDDEIDLGGRILKVIDLCGHTPGSVGFLDSRTGALISGDPIQRNGRVFMFGAQRNIPAALASLERLSAYKKDIREIWPSHADCPLQYEDAENVKSDFKKILNGYHEGEEADVHGRRAFACRTDHNIYLLNV